MFKDKNTFKNIQNFYKQAKENNNPINGTIINSVAKLRKFRYTHTNQGI